MPSKPATAAGYSLQQTLFVRRTCLYIATILGDLMEDLVIVGGLVPTLLIDQDDLPEGAERHVGTMDLDIGLSVVLLDTQRYKTVAQRLRSAGFVPGLNEKGNPSRQTWVIEHTARVTVDFLIPPTLDGDKGGRLRDLEPDFAAFLAPGLQLAFIDQVEVVLDDRTILGELAKRTIRVCGPGAYVVLKALAVRLRGEAKDAYDLYYFVKNYGSGVQQLSAKVGALLGHAATRQALGYL